MVQRPDVGRDVNQRELRAVAGSGAWNLGVGEPLRDGVDAAGAAAPDGDGGDGEAAGARQAVGHGAAEHGGGPGGIGRVQHVGARGVVRDQDDLAAPARRDGDAVQRGGHLRGGAVPGGDGHVLGGALLGARHVELVELAVGAVGDEQGLAVGRGDQAAEALDGVVRGRFEVPGLGRAVGADLDQRAGERADDERGAVAGVVGDVLVAAVGAIGEGREVGLP
ncbi:hypothetical protein PG984_012034 [Apiospora sp. TS-2023a]